MPKPKLINEGGAIIQVPDEKTPEIIEVTYTQAKKLMKKEPTEAQKLNAQRLVEMNRVKWEAKKKAKEELFKQQQAELEARTTKVVVKPKRIYPSREKPVKQAPKHDPQPQYESESDDETASDDSDIQYTKPKPPQVKVIAPARLGRSPDCVNVKHVEKKLQKIQEIDNKINEIKTNNQQSTYSALLSKFWKS